MLYVCCMYTDTSSIHDKFCAAEINTHHTEGEGEKRERGRGVKMEVCNTPLLCLIPAVGWANFCCPMHWLRFHWPILHTSTLFPPIFKLTTSSRLPTVHSSAHEYGFFLAPPLRVSRTLRHAPCYFLGQRPAGAARQDHHAPRKTRGHSSTSCKCISVCIHRVEGRARVVVQVFLRGSVRPLNSITSFTRGLLSRSLIAYRSACSRAPPALLIVCGTPSLLAGESPTPVEPGEMSAGTVLEPPPMYCVRPYFEIKKVRLPNCMYQMKPLHNLTGMKTGQDEVCGHFSLGRRMPLFASQTFALKQISSHATWRSCTLPSNTGTCLV